MAIPKEFRGAMLGGWLGDMAHRTQAAVPSVIVGDEVLDALVAEVKAQPVPATYVPVKGLHSPGWGPVSPKELSLEEVIVSIDYTDRTYDVVPSIDEQLFTMRSIPCPGSFG